MKDIERLEEHKDDEFDKIIMLIRSGQIRSGKYAGLIKINKNFKMDKHELFADSKHTKG